MANRKRQEESWAVAIKVGRERGDRDACLRTWDAGT